MNIVIAAAAAAAGRVWAQAQLAQPTAAHTIMNRESRMISQPNRQHALHAVIHD